MFLKNRYKGKAQEPIQSDSTSCPITQTPNATVTQKVNLSLTAPMKHDVYGHYYKNKDYMPGTKVIHKTKNMYEHQMQNICYLGEDTKMTSLIGDTLPSTAARYRCICRL